MRLAEVRSLLGLTAVLIAAGLVTLIQAGAPLPSDSFDEELLSFDDRVRYQHAIEEVYWRHRIWPAQNPGPKPALDQVLPEAVLRERVETYLQQGAALEVFWSRPLTGEQLQAETNRMVRDTNDPALLRELFAALDNDPFLVAECLARPVLTERLTRSWYARDARFHGALRKQAKASLAKFPNGTPRMQDLGGEYGETEWRLVEDEARPAEFDRKTGKRRVVALSAEEWREGIGRLAASHGIDLEADGTDGTTAILRQIPVGTPSGLAEENDRFLVTAVLSKGADRLQIAVITWSKTPFGAWWTEDGRTIVKARGDAAPVSPPSGGYELQALRDGGCTADTWTELWYVPAARVGHSAVWTGAEMLVWGGWDAHQELNTGGRYSPATDSWNATSAGVDVPVGREGHTAVWTGSEMIVWGGYDDDGFLDTGGRYDPATGIWTQTSTGTGVPAARSSHTGVWTGTEMIVWGGASDGTVFNSGGRYDPATDSWNATSTQLGVPIPRGRHTAVWTGTVMIVWGGAQQGAPLTLLNTGGRYDPATDSWNFTSTGAGVPAARQYHTMVWTGTEMIVWGGSFYDGETHYLDTGGRYDPATNSWNVTSTGAGVPAARQYHTGIWTGTEMIVWGGCTNGSCFGGNLATGGRYDPSTDSWIATSTEFAVPLPRYTHTAVWTGIEMIVWGGNDGKHLQGTGGRYDPATDSWIATSVGADVPTGRSYHTAVWTGAEMIVWGGSRYVTPLYTGGKYDPATDSWTEISTGVGVPKPRRWHTAVWTGTEMIVWGGWAYGERLGTGGRYNPAADSWAETSQGIGLETGRIAHTAVWTGSEMIVWGGSVYTHVQSNTGGRYDPLTDSWKATSVGFGVPRRREDHTAVWTGAEMTIWGGLHARTHDEDSGGRYDPATDRWTATSEEAGVPSSRYGHLAVWTGTQMIVWGGRYSYGTLNSGGRYDPLTDSWTATSTGTGVPTPTWNAPVLWTGSEMIVWGGNYTGTGGRYDPWTDSWSATSTGAGMPPARCCPTAVWTGTKMIVWGGDRHGPLNSGGLYCVCDGDTVSIWYPDADGDGLGVDSTGVLACEQPAGYIATGGDCDDRFAGCTTECTDADADGMPACAPDCDDANPTCTTDCTDADADTYCVTHDCDDANADTHPGADEVNDGEDNHCLYDHGYGIVDEITGVCGFHNPANPDEFSWPPQAGATSYEVARSTDRVFSTDCLVTPTVLTHWVDPDPVSQGACHYYLVRSTQPNLGSWGASSAGVERTPVCP